MLVDCHAHLDPFSDGDVSQILDRAHAAGIDAVISAGTTVESSARSVELSARFPGLFSGVGIHPMDIREPFDDSAAEQLRRLATSTTKVVVFSEIGLDFIEGAPDREVQYDAFRQQIRFARDLKLPIVFHSRESHDEVIRVLREERAYEVGGAMHYFQADEPTARKAIDLGFYISLARPLLRLPHLREVASGLPLESIVLESDAAPQPFKSKRESWTEPRHVRTIAEKLAELHAQPVEEIEKVTTANVRALLGDGWEAVETYASSRSATRADSRPQNLE